MLVPDRHRRVVPDTPSSGREPPDEVDVLPYVKALVESQAEGITPHDQGRRGDVRDLGGRLHASRPASHVQAGVACFVRGDATGTRIGGQDPRGDRARRWIAEVPGQAGQGPGVDDDIGVDERDERCVRVGEACVPRRGRSSAQAVADDDGAVRDGDMLSCGRVRRAVVDDYDRSVGRGRAIASRQRVSCSGRPCAGTMTAISAFADGVGSGTSIPASNSCRASAPSALPGPTSPPTRHLATAAAPAGVRRISRDGEPPSTRQSSSRVRVPGASRTTKSLGGASVDAQRPATAVISTDRHRPRGRRQ